MYRIIGADGREYGPISADQLRQWIAQSRANAATRVLVEGATEWKPLGSLPEFSMLVASTTPWPGVPPTFPGQLSGSVNNGFATAGLVCGIFSLICLCGCYGFPFNITGLICSIVAIGQINRNPERYHGKGMATAGLVLSIISIVLSTIILIVFGLHRGMNFDEVTHHGRSL